jgi:hypothetical protein
VKIRIIILVCIVLVSGGCKKHSGSSDNMLTEEQIIAIADEVVSSEGPPISAMKAEFDVDNKKWEKTLSALIRDDPDFARRYDILNNRSYQSVRYVPDTNQIFAGEFYVFVDKKTGEVIAYCGGI